MKKAYVEWALRQERGEIAPLMLVRVTPGFATGSLARISGMLGTVVKREPDSRTAGEQFLVELEDGTEEIIPSSALTAQ